MQEPQQAIDEHAVRHNIRRFLIVYLILVLAGGLIGGLVGLAAGHHHHRAHHSAGAAGAVTALVVGVLALAVGLVSLYWVFHRRSYRRVMQYSWSRRRRVFRTLRKGKPLPAEDRPVADAMMYLNRNWRRNLLIAFPLIILFLLLDGAMHHGGARWFWIALAVGYVFLIPVARWQQHRIEANYHRLVRSDPPPEPTA